LAKQIVRLKNKTIVGKSLKSIRLIKFQIIKEKMYIC